MPRKPNLLFLFTDQQRYDTMACYGNEWIQTPSLNALANGSFVFERAYVTQPVCTPSRASIMTGLFPHTCGCVANNIPLRPETKTIAEMVDGDYACGYFGKWHLGDEVVAQHGFKHWISIEDNYRGYYSKDEYLSILSDYHRFLTAKGFAPNGESMGAKVFSRQLACMVQERYTKPAFLAQEVERFLGDNGDQPFMLYVNFLEPHTPYTSPYYELYPRDTLPVPEHFLKKPAENASYLHQLIAEHYMNTSAGGRDLRTEEGWRDLRSEYMGNVTLVDRAVGRMLQALEATGQADNTIVVFTSDHGDCLGDHGIFAKTVMYDEAARVPLLVRVPWLSDAQQNVKGTVSQVDLVPTLLDLMGQAVPDGLDGRTLASVLSDGRSLEDNDAIIEWNGNNGHTMPKKSDVTPDRIEEVRSSPWRNIVTGDGWKLNLSPVDQCELYDLNTDPGEVNNLFSDPGQKPRIRDLTDRIRRWQEDTKDEVSLPGV